MPFVPWILGNYGMTGGISGTHAALDLRRPEIGRKVVNPDSFAWDGRGSSEKPTLVSSRL